LPGETIEIREGEIWIDGRLAEKPAEIAALEYTDVPGEPGDPIWQQYGGPRALGPDEYFTIGDFSRYSNDSRIWRQPLTSSHLDGVVTHIYWPPSRWRAFR
jgi:signal peptidase I